LVADRPGGLSLQKIMNNFLQFFIPQLMETFNSEFSGKVDVFKFQNKFFIKAGQIHQSGGWADALFKNVVRKFIVGVDLLVDPQSGQTRRFVPTKILILGLAGGTLVKILTKMYPNINITAVDVDPVMVDIGRKYFGLNTYKNLKIKIADALQYIANNNEKYDLVIIDIFQGDKTPVEFAEKEFIANVLSSVIKGGYVIINRLYFSKKLKEETNQYYKNLTDWQNEVGYRVANSYRNIGNKVLFLRKQGKIRKN
jgi:predicted O-methyltransferase YrrM